MKILLLIVAQYLFAAFNHYGVPEIRDAWFWFYPLGVHVAVVCSLPVYFVVRDYTTEEFKGAEVFVTFCCFATYSYYLFY